MSEGGTAAARRGGAGQLGTRRAAARRPARQGRRAGPAGGGGAGWRTDPARSRRCPGRPNARRAPTLEGGQLVKELRRVLRDHHLPVRRLHKALRARAAAGLSARQPAGGPAGGRRAPPGCAAALRGQRREASAGHAWVPCRRGGPGTQGSAAALQQRCSAGPCSPAPRGGPAPARRQHGTPRPACCCCRDPPAPGGGLSYPAWGRRSCWCLGSRSAWLRAERRGPAEWGAAQRAGAAWRGRAAGAITREAQGLGAAGRQRPVQRRRALRFCLPW
jgi:hypothetical protein